MKNDAIDGVHRYFQAAVCPDFKPGTLQYTVCQSERIKQGARSVLRREVRGAVLRQVEGCSSAEHRTTSLQAG